jgi:hypothetical protein
MTVLESVHAQHDYATQASDNPWRFNAIKQQSSKKVNRQARQERKGNKGNLFFACSASSAINMLGWSLFFGLSSLLSAPVFAGKGLQKFIRIVFLINGVCCLLGGVGFALNITALVFVTINFGMGGAVIVLTLALCVLFRRLMR